jgi:hypothetical protein
MHVTTSHVKRSGVPGLVTLVSRRGEMHVDAIGSLQRRRRREDEDTHLRING